VAKKGTGIAGIDYTNQKIGNWTFLKRDDESKYSGKWFVLCICGKVYSRAIYKIIDGQSKSCGCTRSDLMLRGEGDVSYSLLYRRLINNAKTRGIFVSITKEQHKEIISKNCYYCGVNPPKFNAYYRISDGNIRISKENWYNKKYIEKAWIYANGVDRLNSLEDYTLENSVSCCIQCNIMKNDYSQKEFLEGVERIYTFQKNKINGQTNSK